MININLLPKNLRRVREPGYWRALAVLFPILVLAVAGGMQYFANTTVNNLQREKLAREDQLALLQPFLREQRDLLARQQQLNQLISVAQSVRENNVLWTSEIAGLLETLPAGSGPTPVIDFTSLSMRSYQPLPTMPCSSGSLPVTYVDCTEVVTAGNIGLIVVRLFVCEFLFRKGVCSQISEDESPTISMTTVLFIMEV